MTRSLWAALGITAGCLVGGPVHAEPPSAGSGPELDVSALAASDEALYVGSFDAGLYVMARGQPLRAFADPALGPHINALAWAARERVLWVGTARGLARCPAGESCTRVGPDAGVHALSVSSSGALFAGGDAGLTVVEQARVRTFGKKDGAPFRSVWALAEAGGRLFVGTTSGLFWGAPAAFSGHGAGLGRAAIVFGTLPDDWVTALDYRAGRLFAGTYSAGVSDFQVTSAGLVPAGLDGTLGYVNPDGVVAIDAGCVAIATMDGLRVGTLSHTVEIATRARDVTAFVPDPHGGFWIGTRAGVEFWSGTCPSAG